MQRPLSVALIAVWNLISALGALGLLVFYQNPCTLAEAPPAHLLSALRYAAILTSLDVVINTAVGVALLAGIFWSRWLYLGWFVVSTMIAISIAPGDVPWISRAPGVAVGLICCFFLFQPKATEYFREHRAKKS